jgi:hypothetical protein
LADSKPQQHVGAESNEEQGVGDATPNLHPDPDIGVKLRGEEVRVARGITNPGGGVQSNPNSARDERRPKKDSEQWNRPSRL